MYFLQKNVGGKEMKRILSIILGCGLVLGFLIPLQVSAADYQKEFDSMVDYYSQMNDEAFDSGFDWNQDGIVDILDVANASKQLGIIDISKIKKNYLKVISQADKRDYESLGIPVLTTKSFVVTKEGLDLFGYVNAARGMRLEFIKGDRDFKVENDKLYLTAAAPAMAQVRLINDYAKSEPFYVYGTSDRSLHSFTYDYLINVIQNQ